MGTGRVSGGLAAASAQVDGNHFVVVFVDLGASCDLFGVSGVELDGRCPALDVVHGPGLFAAHTLEADSSVRVVVGALPLDGDDLHPAGGVLGALAVAGGEIYVE